MIENHEVAKMFEQVADLLEIKGELIFKINAYRRVAQTIYTLPENLRELMTRGELREVPGVGDAIYKKLEEIITTGHMTLLQKLEEEIPLTLIDVVDVPDVGPKTAALLWKQAGVTTVEELETAALSGKLDGLPGFGVKKVERILQGIEALRRRSKRLMLPAAWKIANQWVEFIRSLPGIEKVAVAGSLARWKSTIGDLDLVAAGSRPEETMASFCSHPDVMRIVSQGSSKSSIEIAGGINIQLWLQPTENFGSLLQYATGSKEHNVHLRSLAQNRGFSLSEQGLTDGNGQTQHFASEEELYGALGLPWIPPELREDRGEIEAGLENRLPVLVRPEDMTADLHIHSTWSDGRQTIEDVARAARDRGLKVLAIADHSGGVGVNGSLTASRLKEQREEIEMVEKKMGGTIRILHGLEVEILSDGSLDFPDDVLAGLDLVVGSMHYDLRQPRDQVTRRLIRAIRSPHVDIIAHPSGRLWPDVESADLDWGAVIAAARDTGTILEINSNPNRLDMDDINARTAANAGVLISIDTDSHQPSNLERAIYGVSVARRAWLSPQHLISTWKPDRIVDWFNTPKEKRAPLMAK